MKKKSRSQPRLDTVVDLDVVSLPARDVHIDSLAIPAAQAAFLARFGLDAPRARLTAELAWGCR